MASVPFLVKVLSLKLRTRSSGLCRMAEANAITPAWLMPFWGMWTSSRLPISLHGKAERALKGKWQCFSQLIIKVLTVITPMFTNMTDVFTASEGEKKT